MAWFSALNPITAIKAIADVIKEPIKGWQDRKTAKVAAKIVIQKIQADTKKATAESKLELAKQGVQIQGDWDARAQEQMKTSWKDEALMLVLFFPVVVMFIAAVFASDAMIERMIRVVKSLEEFPSWYVIMLLGIVAAVYGLRWLIQPVVTKMQGRKELIDKIGD